MDKKKKIMIGMVILVILVLGGTGFRYWSDRKNSIRVQSLKRDQFFMEKYVVDDSIDEQSQEEQLLTTPVPRTGESAIKVDIEGAVLRPGVYSLKEGERLDTLIEAAGGFTSDAHIKGINRAEKVEDEGYYYVPSAAEIEKGEVKPIDISNSKGKDDSKKSIDINSADREELMDIPGVGEVRALAIIEYREKNGGFKKVEELKNISGIGDKTFEKLRDFIDIR